MSIKRPVQFCITATALSVAATCTITGDPPAEPVVRSAGEVVFESVRRITDDGRVLGTSARGDLEPAVALRAGRPWAFFDEPVGYDDEAWSVGNDDGTTESGYRVLRSAERAPILRVQTAGRATVGAALARRMTAAAAGERVSVMVVLRGVPRWTIPLRSDYARSAVDLAQAADERAAALAERKAQIRALAVGPAAQIEELGGRITGRGRYGGWLTAELPSQAIDALAGRTDVARLELSEGRVEPAGIRLGDVRGQPFIDADRFLAAGYTGERANPSRHSYGDITIGVIEPGSLEDEACFLYDGANCTGPSRLRERFQCDDPDGDGNHEIGLNGLAR